MVDDHIFREVEEELRRERFANLWKRFGTVIIGAIVGVVVVILGILWWQDRQVANRQAAGDTFIEALKLASTGKEDEANAKLETLAEDSTDGYELLARLHLAAKKAAVGQTAEAELLYKKIVVDASADSILRDYAKLNLALLRLDGATHEETLNALKGFIEPGGAWRSTALEVVALAAMKEGKFEQAQERFTEIVSDSATPSALRRRAQIMLDVIATRKAEARS